MTEKKDELATIEAGNLEQYQNSVAEMGFDVEKETKEQHMGVMQQPYLRVEHDKTEGNHGFYIQIPETIFGDDTGIVRLGTKEKPVSEVEVQVLFMSSLRGYYPDDWEGKLPKCGAIQRIDPRGVPYWEVQNFVAEENHQNKNKGTCEGCGKNRFGSDCKNGIRLMIGLKCKLPNMDEDIYPFMFQIPPTGLTSFNKITKMCKRSKVPVQAFAIRCFLEDTEHKNGRFGKLNFEVSNGVSKDQIAFGKSAREAFQSLFMQAADSGDLAAKAGEEDEGDAF